jgi:hypothetical protein
MWLCVVSGAVFVFKTSMHRSDVFSLQAMRNPQLYLDKPQRLTTARLVVKVCMDTRSPIKHEELHRYRGNDMRRQKILRVDPIHILTRGQSVSSVSFDTAISEGKEDGWFLPSLVLACRKDS